VSTTAATPCGSGSWRPASTAATSPRSDSRSSTSAICRSRETAKHQRPSGLNEKGAEPKKTAGGFNPYDSAGESAGGNPYDNARNTQRRIQQSSPSAPPARKPMDLKRLEEWMEIRKRLEQQKKDDDED
jgi:hypothetical protein